MNIYIGAMGMISHQNKLEVIGNNVANSRTNGFKKDTETFKVFEETYMNMLGEGKKERIGAYQNQVQTDEVHTNWKQGGLVQTGRNTDFALRDVVQGETNFFTVERDGEEMLTKDGAFQIDEAGQLSMNDGTLVLDNLGQRVIVPDNARMSIDREGRLIDQNTGEEIAELGIVKVSSADYNLLEKVGNNKFRVISTEDFVQNYGPLENLLENYDNNISLRRLFPERQTVEQIVNQGQIGIVEVADNYEMMTGVLEQSNVDLADEMTNLIVAQRGYQASSKVLQVMDGINEKDANQLGI